MSNITIANQVIKKMTSKEIADLVDQRHDNVKRTMETLGEKGVITLPQIEEVQNTGHGPKTIGVYSVGKRDSLIVVAQLCPEFTARIVDRWQELEELATKPAFVIPQTYTEALRLAADLADGKAKAELAVVEKQKQLDVAQPKAEALDLFSTFAEGSMCLTNAAKALQIQPKKFFAWMQENQWVYRRAGGSGLVGYQSRIQVGYLEHKVTTVERTDGTTKQAEQVLVTAKGLAKLALLFSSKTPANDLFANQAA